MEGSEQKNYLTIGSEGSGGCEEKRSRFLARAFHAETEEECEEKLQWIRREHHDARHNCYARVLGRNGALQRFSDDGEPSGTAGKPILDVITGAGLTDCMIVVTRYFGGTLLGTGGLVRNYSLAAANALAGSSIVLMCHSDLLEIRIDYTFLDRILFELGRQSVVPENTEYLEKVILRIRIPSETTEFYIRKITEMTSGKAELKTVESGFFPIPAKNASLTKE